MIRIEVQELLRLGAFPASTAVNVETIQRQRELLDAIGFPVSDEEARELMNLFGPDDYFGLAWTVLHLIESAPHWPLPEVSTVPSHEWIHRLNLRVSNRKDFNV